MQGTGLVLYAPVFLMIRSKQEATLSPNTARAVFWLHLAYQVREERDKEGGRVYVVSDVRVCGV